MPRKRAIIFQKVSNMLKISIFIAKMKKPISPKLKKFKLLKHYNFRYIQEYQFSPSSAPLIHYPTKPIKKRKYRDICPILFLCQCLGRLRAEGGGHRDYSLEALPSIEDIVGRELSKYRSDSGGEEDSVDERAERFIESFYEEMRMQRQESLLELMEFKKRKM